MAHPHGHTKTNMHSKKPLFDETLSEQSAMLFCLWNLLIGFVDVMAKKKSKKKFEKGFHQKYWKWDTSVGASCDWIVQRNIRFSLFPIWPEASENFDLLDQAPLNRIRLLIPDIETATQIVSQTNENKVVLRQTNLIMYI